MICLVPSTPLFPAKAGIQTDAGLALPALGDVADSAWVPAFAGMSGGYGGC
jgi:hypothetical protein